MQCQIKFSICFLLSIPIQNQMFFMSTTLRIYNIIFPSLIVKKSIDILFINNIINLSRQYFGDNEIQ